MSNKTNTTTNSNSSSTKKSSAATAAAHPKHDPSPPLWELPAGPVLDAWLSRTLQQAVDNVQKSSSSNRSSINNNMNTKQQQQQQITPETVALWLQHIVSSVQAIELKEAPSPPPPAATAAADDDDDHMNEPEEQEQRPAKRARFARTKKKPKIILELQDPYHIWWITKYTQKPVDITDTNDYEDLPDVLGGRLAQLSVGAWLNALLQFPLVHKAHPTTAVVLKTCLQQQLLLQQAAPPAPFVNYQTYVLETWHVATEMHRLVQNTVQSDIWRTTPSRIQEYLAPDVTLAEFESIRKRVYETVILGKGLHTSTTTTKDDDDEWAAAQNGDIPVAPGLLMQHDVEKYKKCPSCGNQDQATFALDRKNGDIICSNCGVVVSESLMHEGSAYRKFEGEADRNHHGDAANPLYSNAHNMSTTLSGIAPMSSGIEGYAGGAGSKGGSLEAILRNAHAWTELNLSQLGTKNNKDRRTRIGYKDRQKKEAFVQMTHTGDALHLHEAVVQRAKELFAGFRDDRELVQQFKGVLAACLCEAFEQLSRDESGRMLIKGVGGNELQQQQEQQQHEAAASAEEEEEEEEEKPIKLSARAQRRQDLHHATLAGKGGLLLDFSNVRSSTAAKVGGTDNAEVATSTAATSPTDPVAAAAAPEQSKPAASWDLDDCRSWLLGASRRIAQQWVKERQEAVNKEAAAKFPAGPLEELEGMLVEHSIVLCEELEQELHSRNSNGNSSNGNAVKLQKNRVVTPRVQDMSKLGIQWQHAHERGSGGKGGIGGSGTAVKKAAAVTAKVAANQKGGRTAGQVLLLKSAKKLGTLLNDPLAGEAIHRELRAVIAKQETQKRQKMLEEASRQRFLQMKRKPWLQARAQIES